MTKKIPMRDEKVKLKKIISQMENCNAYILRRIDLLKKRRDSVIATLQKQHDKRAKEIEKRKQKLAEIK